MYYVKWTFDVEANLRWNADVILKGCNLILKAKQSNDKLENY